MPVFDLTSQQLQAFETLRWLHSPQEGDRRTGRTFVLALSYLWRCLNTRGWVEASDHVQSRDMRHHLFRTIIDLGYECGMRMEINPRGDSIRVVDCDPSEALQALTQFGESGVETPAAKPKAEEPPTPIWDHLLDSE